MNFTKVKQAVCLNNILNQTILSEEAKLNSYMLLKNNIKNIIFKGINNQVIKDILIHDTNIKHIFKTKEEINIKKINLVINKLRYCGSFDKIKASYLLLNNKHYLLIKVQLNTIVREITVSNANTLQIPQKYLVSLLNKQIGCPKNLKLISNIINSIKSWYYIRGYKWIKVSYEISESSFSKINITIVEKKISIVEITDVDSNVQTHKKNLEPFIIHTLNVYRGEKLNFYNTEFGLIKLKTRKPSISCKYEVKCATTNTLKIIIKYYYPKTSISYIFHRSVYLNSQLFNLLKKEAYILFNYLLNNFKNLAYQQKKTHIYPNFLFMDNYFNSIKLNYKNLILSNLFYFKNQYQNKTFPSIKNNLKLQHYISNFNNLCSRFFINLEKNQEKTQILISYNHSKVDNISYYDSELLIYGFKYISKIKKAILKPLYKNLYEKNRFFTHHHNIYGTTVSLVENFIPNLSINHKLSLCKDVYKINYLYNVNNWKNIYKFFKLVNSIVINKLHKVYEKFINYHIVICSNKLNFKKTFVPQNTLLFSLQSYSPLMVDSEEFYRSSYLSHLISAQYKKIINFSKNTLNTLVNTFIFSFELKILWKFKQYIPIELFSNPNLKQNLFSNSNQKQYFYTSLEYHIYKQYNVSLFVFFSHKQFINQLVSNNLHHIITNKQDLNYTIGTGINVHLPINQMPIVKIKHSLNYDGTSRLYAKLYFK